MVDFCLLIFWKLIMLTPNMMLHVVIVLDWVSHFTFSAYEPGLNWSATRTLQKYDGLVDRIDLPSISVLITIAVGTLQVTGIAVSRDGKQCIHYIIPHDCDVMNLNVIHEME